MSVKRFICFQEQMWEEGKREKPRDAWNDEVFVLASDYDALLQEFRHLLYNADDSLDYGMEQLLMACKRAHEFLHEEAAA